MNKYIRQIFTGAGKFIIGVCILVFVLFLFIPGMLSLFSSDMAPINDSDLLLSEVHMADEENMFFVLDQIDPESMYEPDGVRLATDALNSDGWDHAVAMALFQRNATALDLWRQAAERDGYLLPHMAHPQDLGIDSPSVSMNRFRQVSHLSVAQAVYLARLGSNQAAVDEAMKSVKIGNAMMTSQNNLIGYLVGMALQTNGLDALQKIIAITGGEGIDRASLLIDLDKYRLPNEDYAYVKSEYMLSKQVVLDLRQQQAALAAEDDAAELFTIVFAHYVNNDFYFQPNTTISYSADGFRQLIRNAQAGCAAEPPPVEAVEFLPTSFWDYPKLYFTQNAIGKRMLSVAFVALNNVIRKNCALQARQQTVYQMVEAW